VIFAAGYGTDVYACFKPTGQLRFLASTDDFVAAATAGDYVAFSEVYGSDPEASGTPVIRIQNLRTGRIVRQAKRDAGTLFVSARGVAAWPEPAYCPTATGPHSCPGTVLYVLDHHGPRAVGHGDIRLSSVRFSGAMLAWTTPGRTHRVRVCS